MRYVLDTHALVWHLTNDSRLGKNARHILENENSQLIVPTLVLAEAKHIADRKRVTLSFDDILRSVITAPQTTIFPLDVFALAYLPQNLDIHDGLIVATALYCREFLNEEIIVITYDIAITHSNLVSTMW